MYTIGDTVIRIKNGYAARRDTIEVPYSRMVEAIMVILAQENYIKGYRFDKKQSKKNITIDLRYDKGKPAIMDLKIISKPGKRTYVSSASIKPVLAGMGRSILTTPQGVMTDRTARERKVGGEVLFNIW